MLNFTARMTAVSVIASVPSPNRGAIIGKYHICVCTALQLRKWLWSRWIVLITQWLGATHGGLWDLLLVNGDCPAVNLRTSDNFKNI